MATAFTEIKAITLRMHTITTSNPTILPLSEPIFVACSIVLK
jgi:hypothetical protein